MTLFDVSSFTSLHFSLLYFARYREDMKLQTETNWENGHGGLSRKQRKTIAIF
jgi:hypothetical protein